MAYDTAKTIINDAATLLGLDAVSSPFTSSSGHIVQLRAILKSAGRDMVRDFEWPHLRVRYNFTTVAAQESYTMPADFNRWVNQTEWNTSSRIPLGGPITPQGWELLKVFNLVGAVQLFFFTKANLIYVTPTPQSANTIALQYLSEYWVQPDGESAGSQNEPTDDDDTILFDSQMMVHRLRRDFQRIKGFDSTAASDDYDRALERAQGNAEAAPVLNLNHSPANRARLLDNANIPPTGYGT